MAKKKRKTPEVAVEVKVEADVAVAVPQQSTATFDVNVKEPAEIKEAEIPPSSALQDDAGSSSGDLDKIEAHIATLIPDHARVVIDRVQGLILIQDQAATLKDTFALVNRILLSLRKSGVIQKLPKTEQRVI